jgi:hypothetical protein
MFDLETANREFYNLMDWVEEQTALAKQFPVFDPDFDVSGEE